MRVRRENQSGHVRAERRYLTIGHTIPHGLDRPVQLLDEALALPARYALQPGRGPNRTTAEDLPAAAQGLPAAESRIPRPGCSRQPPPNTGRPTQAAPEPAPLPLAADLTERVPMSASVDAQVAVVSPPPAGDTNDSCPDARRSR